MNVLKFAAVVEIATGLALLVVPGIVVTPLLGNLPAEAMPVARVAGIAMLALGVACWPATTSASAATVGMLAYNALIAFYLAYLYLVGHLGGVLLWPAVALHAVMAVLLLRAWRSRRVDL